MYKIYYHPIDNEIIFITPDKFMIFEIESAPGWCAVELDYYTRTYLNKCVYIGKFNE